jgi:hypothetical protein
MKTLVALLLAIPLLAQSQARSPLEQILGRPGAAQPGGVTKFSFPRSDLTVVADGVTLKPAFALGGWVAFKKIDRGMTMAMGDLVLTEDEVTPVMLALQEGGVEQTAVHNHLLNESPRIVYLHISAIGDETRIATAIRDALAKTGTPLVITSPAATPNATDLDTAGIARALGFSGKLNGVVYQVSIPRPEKIRDEGREVPPSMGTSTAINFQPTGNGRAAITGDFVLRDREVNPVIRALQAHGIRPTAIHSHMLFDEPRLLFMHFWGQDDAVALAKGLRAALDQMSLKTATPAN